MKLLHNIKLFMVMSLVFYAGNVVGMDADMAGQALFNAARLGNLENVQAAIAEGTNVNWSDNYGWTSLMVAIMNDRLDIVQALIEAGADVNIIYDEGWTALMIAVSNNRLDIVQALIEAGADVNIRNNNGSTALMGAPLEGRLDMIHLIINADGFDPDQLQPIIDHLHAKENKTGVEQELFDILQQRQTFNSIGLK